eukprot:Nk52_evm3s229 gene=Nk52_evmTU3s229
MNEEKAKHREGGMEIYEVPNRSSVSSIRKNSFPSILNAPTETKSRCSGYSGEGIEDDKDTCFLSEETSVAYYFTNKFGYGKYQHKRMFLPAYAAFCDGIEIFLAGLLNYNLGLVDEWSLKGDGKAFSSLASVVFVGMAVGSVLFSALSDHFGRRPVFVLCNFFYFICHVNDSSGSYGSIHGGHMPNTYNNGARNESSKKLETGHYGIQCFLTFFYPETVRFHESKGNFQAMEDILIRMGIENQATEDQLNEVRSRCSELRREFDMGRLALKREQTTLEKMMQATKLFSRENIRITTALAFGWFAMSFNLYGLSFYLQKVLDIHGFEPDNIYKTTLVNTTGLLAGTLATALALQWMEYRMVISLTSLTCAAFAIGFAFSSTSSAIVALAWLYQFSIGSIQTALYTLAPLVYHSYIRASGIGFGSAVIRISGVVVSYSFNAILSTSDIDSVKIAYGISAILAFLTAIEILLFVKRNDKKKISEVL